MSLTHKKHKLGLETEARRVRYTLSYPAANTMYIAGQFYDYNNNPVREKTYFKAWVTTSFTSYTSPSSSSFSANIAVVSGTTTRTDFITAAGNSQYQLEGYSNDSGYFTITYSSVLCWAPTLHMLINNKYLVNLPNTSGGLTSALASAGFSGWGE